MALFRKHLAIYAFWKIPWGGLFLPLHQLQKLFPIDNENGFNSHVSTAGMRNHRWGVATGSRKAAARQSRLPTEILYVLAPPAGGERRSVAVPKEDQS
jgi:hypothetical protein